MPDYSKGKIYRLVCNITGKQYIGSTCYTLAQRKAKHVWTVKHDNSKIVASKPIIDAGDFSIILIEDYPCENVEQLRRRERYYIETLECVNKLLPIREEEESKELSRYNAKMYRENNKDKVKEMNKKWNQDNKEHLNERRRKYYETTQKFKYNESKTCECGKTYTHQHKARHEKSKFHQEYLKKTLG